MKNKKFSAAKRVLLFFGVIFLLAMLSISYPELTGKDVLGDYENEPAVLTRVIDGDTIETSLGEVRLLGINTPEKKARLYSEAKSFLSLIENKSIELLRDKEDEDKYYRKLRYVFYGSRMVNLEILERGLASSYMADGLKYEQKILRAEQYARDAELGIWEKSEEKCANCIALVELDAEQEFFILENKCDFGCSLEGWKVKDAGRNTIALSPISGRAQAKIESEKGIWNNDGDRFFMTDKAGKLVVFYEYADAG